MFLGSCTVKDNVTRQLNRPFGDLVFKYRWGDNKIFLNFKLALPLQYIFQHDTEKNCDCNFIRHTSHIFYFVNILILPEKLSGVTKVHHIVDMAS